jgi:hypothetical protein
VRDLTKRQAFWKRHLDALKEFDGTAVEYARRHGVDVRALYGYKKRLKKRAARPVRTARFVAVRPAAAIDNPGVVVALRNGVRLALPDLEAPGLLERLARL